MSTFTEQSDEAILAFCCDNPDYTVNAVQPEYRGGTNCISLGYAGAQPIVYKYFCIPPRWENESYCLRHFAHTGLVPRILAEIPDRLIVMTKLSGNHLAPTLSALHGQPAGVQRLSQAFGRAIGQMTQVPLSSEHASAYIPQRDFAILGWGQDLRKTVEHYLETSRRIQQVIAAYQTPLCMHSLALLESQLPSIPRKAELLYHEDISNTMFDGEQIGGFYDLEMCRGGTTAMQLGVALFLCGPEQLDWEAVLTGFQQQTAHRLSDEELLTVLAMSHFYAWIRVCRWGWWDGNPTASDHFAASVADADCYRQTIWHACNLLSRYHPVVMDWLGALGDVVSGMEAEG